MYKKVLYGGPEKQNSTTTIESRQQIQKHNCKLGNITTKRLRVKKSAFVQLVTILGDNLFLPFIAKVNVVVFCDLQLCFPYWCCILVICIFVSLFENVFLDLLLRFPICVFLVCSCDFLFVTEGCTVVRKFFCGFNENMAGIWSFAYVCL